MVWGAANCKIAIDKAEWIEGVLYRDGLRRTPGSVNMRSKIVFSCLQQAEERNFSPHILGIWGLLFRLSLYI